MANGNAIHEKHATRSRTSESDPGAGDPPHAQCARLCERAAAVRLAGEEENTRLLHLNSTYPSRRDRGYVLPLAGLPLDRRPPDRSVHDCNGCSRSNHRTTHDCLAISYLPTSYRTHGRVAVPSWLSQVPPCACSEPDNGAGAVVICQPPSQPVRWWSMSPTPPSPFHHHTTLVLAPHPLGTTANHDHLTIRVEDGAHHLLVPVGADRIEYAIVLTELPPPALCTGQD